MRIISDILIRPHPHHWPKTLSKSTMATHAFISILFLYTVINYAYKNMLHITICIKTQLYKNCTDIQCTKCTFKRIIYIYNRKINFTSPHFSCWNITDTMSALGSVHISLRLPSPLCKVKKEDVGSFESSWQ